MLKKNTLWHSLVESWSMSSHITTFKGHHLLHVAVLVDVCSVFVPCIFLSHNEICGYANGTAFIATCLWYSASLLPCFYHTGFVLSLFFPTWSHSQGTTSHAQCIPQRSASVSNLSTIIAPILCCQGLSLCSWSSPAVQILSALDRSRLLPLAAVFSLSKSLFLQFPKRRWHVACQIPGLDLNKSEVNEIKSRNVSEGE